MEVKNVKTDGVSTYRSLLDPDVESPMTKLPSIPCSKYIILGNPKMRVPRRRGGPVVWKVPRVHGRKRRRAVFRRVDAGDSNEFDEDTLYAERYGHDDVKILPPLLWDDGQPKNTDLMKERQLIEKYNISLHGGSEVRMDAKLVTGGGKSRRRGKAVTRVTFKLPPIEDIGGEYETGAVIVDTLADDEDGETPKYRTKNTCRSPDHKKVCKGSPVCEGEAREFCDVLGQGYCSCCLAYYNRKKHERLMLPIIRANTPKSTTTSSLSRVIQKGAYAKKRSTRKKNSKILTSTCLCSKLPRLESSIGNNINTNTD